jgi:UDP-N-acetylmuramyl tripeptide synthase
VLESARHVVAVRPRAKVLLLLCAGGARNPFKRRPFGTIAGELADRVIVTEGNGRGEPRELVIAELLAGLPVGRPAPDVIPDRGMAIRALVRSARAGDVVVLMGRGAMLTLYSNTAGGGPPFDDRTVARAELVALT